MGKRRAALAAAAGALLSASAASAWQVADPIHHSCHERISAAALDQVGYVQPPPPLSGADASLRNGLQFDAGPYAANIYALSLIIGTRWPDSQGEPSLDFYKLSNVHNAPGDQASHCLREESDVGAETGRHARARRLPRQDHDAVLAGAGDAGPDDGRRRSRRAHAAARVSALPGQDADPGVRLLLLRGARRARDPGQLHPHLPAHGRHRRRPQGSRRSSTGSRRCAATWSKPRTATATRRSWTTARTTTRATPIAWPGRPRRPTALLAALTTPGDGRRAAGAARRVLRRLDDVRSGLLDRERVLRQPGAGLAAHQRQVDELRERRLRDGGTDPDGRRRVGARGRRRWRR